MLSWYFLDERGRSKIDCLISTLSFSWSGLADRRAASASMRTGSVLADLNVPVLQTASLFGTEEEWRKESRGLSPLELTLSVALPEIDGRIASVPLVFRSRPDGDVDRMVASPGRAAMLARMARRWAVLRRRPNVEKRVAVILHNYPSSDGRIGNGVGLDTLMSTVRLLHALAVTGTTWATRGKFQPMVMHWCAFFSPGAHTTSLTAAAMVTWGSISMHTRNGFWRFPNLR